ncbi:hypothetical protein D3C85_1850680 [compost metagenome]
MSALEFRKPDRRFNFGGSIGGEIYFIIFYLIKLKGMINSGEVAVAEFHEDIIPVDSR